MSFQLSFAATLGIVLFAGRFEERFDLLLQSSSGGAGAFPVRAVGDDYGGLDRGDTDHRDLLREAVAGLDTGESAGGAAVRDGAGRVGAHGSGRGGGCGARARRWESSVTCRWLLLVMLADFAASLPLASIAVTGHGILDALAMYGLVRSCSVWLLRRRPRDPEEVTARRVRVGWAGVTAMAVVGAAVVVWWGALSPENDRLRVTVLDVGQGDAILIETPEGHTILVDGGPSGSVLMQALGEALPASERDIDLVVLTHAQDDHVSGLVEVMRRYDVGASDGGTVAGRNGSLRRVD